MFSCLVTQHVAPMTEGAATSGYEAREWPEVA